METRCCRGTTHLGLPKDIYRATISTDSLNVRLLGFLGGGVVGMIHWLEAEPLAGLQDHKLRGIEEIFLNSFLVSVIHAMSEASTTVMDC